MLIVGNAAVGAWHLAAHWRPQLATRPLWVTTVVVQVLVFAEVAVGVAYSNREDIEPEELHELYGFSALFAIAILYAYRHQLREKQHLLYGLGSLFIMGLGIRELFLRL